MQCDFRRLGAPAAETLFQSLGNILNHRCNIARVAVWAQGPKAVVDGAVAGKGSLQAAIVSAAPAGKMWIIFIPRKRPVCPSWAGNAPKGDLVRRAGDCARACGRRRGGLRRAALNPRLARRT